MQSFLDESLWQMSQLQFYVRIDFVIILKHLFFFVLTRIHRNAKEISHTNGENLVLTHKSPLWKFYTVF